MTKRSRRLALILACAAAVLAAIAILFMMIWRGPLSYRVAGTVWQLDNATVDIKGSWEQLGADGLLIQWTVVDGLSFVPGIGLPTALRLPDWDRIAREPWARDVIVGLAGRFDERAARTRMRELTELSLAVSRWKTPLNVAGWYFPVEVDPTWSEAPSMAPLLRELPRPLWISVYDSANIGAKPLADWLDTWLPADVGVFFQDGVGVHARGPEVARQYADALADKLGKHRLRVIAEAFRPQATGFRAASAAELRPQIAAYHGYQVYLFDGPHYVSDRLIDDLQAK